MGSELMVIVLVLAVGYWLHSTGKLGEIFAQSGGLGTTSTPASTSTEEAAPASPPPPEAAPILTEIPTNAPDMAKCKEFLSSKSANTMYPGTRPCSEVCMQSKGSQAKCAECEKACGMPHCGCYGTAPEDKCKEQAVLDGFQTKTLPDCPHSAIWMQIDPLGETMASKDEDDDKKSNYVRRAFLTTVPTNWA